MAALNQMFSTAVLAQVRWGGCKYGLGLLAHLGFRFGNATQAHLHVRDLLNTTPCLLRYTSLYQSVQPA